jgi:hypothetical protein
LGALRVLGPSSVEWIANYSKLFQYGCGGGLWRRLHPE